MVTNQALPETPVLCLRIRATPKWQCSRTSALVVFSGTTVYLLQWAWILPTAVLDQENSGVLQWCGSLTNWDKAGSHQLWSCTWTSVWKEHEEMAAFAEFQLVSWRSALGEPPFQARGDVPSLRALIIPPLLGFVWDMLEAWGSCPSLVWEPSRTHLLLPLQFWWRKLKMPRRRDRPKTLANKGQTEPGTGHPPCPNCLLLRAAGGVLILPVVTLISNPGWGSDIMLPFHTHKENWQTVKVDPLPQLFPVSG